MKGTYLLILELSKNTTITIGKQGNIHFKQGEYVYVGSAMNGLDQRIQRHLRTQKKIHWHIDYLLPFTKITSVFYKENSHKEECIIAKSFEKRFYGIPRFGCSDCSCNSHLFSGSPQDIGRIASFLGMKPYLLHTNP